MCRKLQGANQPSKVMNEMNKSSKILRDVFDETFTSITVDDEALHIQIKDYVQKIAPKKELKCGVISNNLEQIKMDYRYGLEMGLDKLSQLRTIASKLAV